MRSKGQTNCFTSTFKRLQNNIHSELVWLGALNPDPVRREGTKEESRGLFSTGGVPESSLYADTHALTLRSLGRGGSTTCSTALQPTLNVKRKKKKSINFMGTFLYFAEINLHECHSREPTPRNKLHVFVFTASMFGKQS